MYAFALCMYGMYIYVMCGMFMFMLQHPCWHHNDGVPFNTPFSFSFLFPIPIPFHKIQFNSIQFEDVKDECILHTATSHS